MDRPGDEERRLLSDSLRGLLSEHWPTHRAVADQADAAALDPLWSRLAAQGLTELGGDPQNGGLSELLVVLRELGRAACPLPLLDAYLANLILSAHNNRARDASALQSAQPSAQQPDQPSTLQSALHSGAAQIGVSFAAYDGDRSAGAVTVAQNRLSGRLRFVDCGVSLTHILVLLDSSVALLACSDPGLRRAKTRALGLDGWQQFELVDCRATVLELSPSDRDRLQGIRRLGLLARAYGAANAAFEAVVDYAKVRQQFGKAIGSFQAVAHKLANCTISLEAVRLLLANTSARQGLIDKIFQIANLMPSLRATWARPAGSVFPGRPGTAASSARRSNRSRSLKKWSAPKRPGSVLQCRPLH